MERCSTLSAASEVLGEQEQHVMIVLMRALEGEVLGRLSKRPLGIVVVGDKAVAVGV